MQIIHWTPTPVKGNSQGLPSCLASKVRCAAGQLPDPAGRNVGRPSHGCNEHVP